MTYAAAVIMAAGCCVALAADKPLTVKTRYFTAEVSRGTVTSLQDAQGNVLAHGDVKLGTVLHRVGKDHHARSESGARDLRAPGRVQGTYGDFVDLPGASVTTRFEADDASGDLVISQQGLSPQKGLWGVGWFIENVPLDMNIIVPYCSGVRLDKDSPHSLYQCDYPMEWEAQLVVVEGRGRGFYVWAEDAQGQYKRLTISKEGGCWRLGFTTMNFAPFDEHTTCGSVRWHLNVYEGDWRVPARRYRDWADANLRPTRVGDQRPAWVKDIRCCVIMGMSIPIIEALATRLDPEQTLLYIPNWRKAGYDRDYPTYDQVVPEFEPFLKRAHELGYRVMVHVNYFGCDPLNPLYEKFEPFQVRSPWGDHAKQWWLWERADPIIKFAYINPACKAWRDLFVSRMKQLCAKYPIDALHLDQTLCIYNDHNGLIDGMSMVEGNLALHRELREALPEVALSGEGLNEVTYRYEAFAQRHAWGVSHSEGTYWRPALRLAHPISSYLFRPYTIIYGYLGMAPPTNPQLYAAWNEAYQHWGVIPTLKPDLEEIRSPKGFSRQFFDEVTFFQRQRVDPDVDGPWPESVFFPLKTAAREPAARMADRTLMWGDREISRTITGVPEVKLPGQIPGWLVYDAERIFGLDPEVWYPYLTEPRDLRAFHVEKLPRGFTVSQVTRRADIAVVRTAQVAKTVAKLEEELSDAITGSRPFEGEAMEMRGPLRAPDGASFTVAEDGFFAHPPWKAERRNPATGVVEASGTGVAYARFALSLPAEGKLRFVSEVSMRKEAVGEGKTDGVTYIVTAKAGEEELRAEVHATTEQPHELSLDLTPLAGREIALELQVHPGPNLSATYDWAYWHRPRIEQDLTTEDELVVVSPEHWAFALTGTEALSLSPQDNRYVIRTIFPGVVFLLNALPDEPVTLPLDITTARFTTTFLSSTGMVLDRPTHASASPGEAAVGGVMKKGLLAHPPDYGRTVVDVPISLPPAAAEFHAFVGLRDGSKSTGVVFIVEANGTELLRQRMLPGEWVEVRGDLSPWAGKPVILSMITDSDGSHYYDWAVWGEPVLRRK